MYFLKYLDLFNIKFYFYTNNQPNYQNKFGGIMTILYIFFCVVIFVAFSLDDLKRLNPITTKNEIPNSERKIINMIKEKIWIPFRIVNYENQFIDHRGGLYIVPYLIEGKFNSEIGMDLKAHLLNYKFCNETSMANMPYNYKIDTPLNQLFCIDRDNITFGGNWNEKFLYYLEINLYLCEEGISYNSSDPRCTKLEKLLENANSSLLFDFYFPIVQFQPTNLSNPIDIIYKNYYYRLTTYSYKVQKLYLLENILSDDKNLIKTSYKNSSYWGMSSLYSDDYYIPNNFDHISNNSNTSRIYALNIYMDDGFVYYTRTFKKILLIISNVFPLFRIVLYILKKFTQHIKMSFIKRKLAGLIFENNKIIPKKLSFKKIEDLNKNSKARNNKLILISNKSEYDLIKDKIINNNDTIKLNDLNFIKNRNKKEKKEKKENNNIISNIFNSKLNNSLNDENNNIKFKMNSNNNSSFVYYNFKRKELLKINKANKKEKYIFPYYYFCFDLVFDNLVNPRKFLCIPKTYFIVYNFMCNIYDISTHLIFFRQLNLLNNIVIEKRFEEKEKGIYDFKSFHPINISDNKIMEKISHNLKGLKKKKSILYSNYFL